MRKDTKRKGKGAHRNLVTHIKKVAARNALARRREAERSQIVPAALHAEEARIYLGGISAFTLRRLVARGLLHPNRMTRHMLFARSELDRFLRE